MKAASVTEVKNRLSHYLRAVAGGETVTILDRGRPVAQLTPVLCEQDELQELVATGIVRPALARLPRSFFQRTLPRSRSSVTRALTEDRKDRF